MKTWKPELWKGNLCQLIQPICLTLQCFLLFLGSFLLFFHLPFSYKYPYLLTPWIGVLLPLTQIRGLKPRQFHPMIIKAMVPINAPSGIQTGVSSECLLEFVTALAHSATTAGGELVIPGKSLCKLESAV